MKSNKFIISITPDIALDLGYTYAGGLGVLEGDKFYAASKLNLNYIVFSLFYKSGYVDYDFDINDNPIPKPQIQSEEFLKSLKFSDEINIQLRNENVKVQVLEYIKGNSKVVFFNPISPEWTTKLTERLYIEENQEIRFFKYVLLAKSSATYIRKNIPLEDIEYIDLQEAYAAVLPLILRIPGKYRMVIHTAGPWGHPTFSRELFKNEFQYSFVDQDIVLTEIGLSVAKQAFAVSVKHFDILLKIFPHHGEKFTFVTNGINLDRWMNSKLREELYGIRMDRFIDIRKELKEKLIDYLSKIKDIDLDDKFIAIWARRIVPYKRPDFPVRLLSSIKDKPIVLVLGGKAHPYDFEGLEYMRIFRKLHKENEKVIYIPNYSIEIAKLLLSGGDLLLFTPFSGWEACGTSYMKAAVNGIPTLASIDGGIPEFIVNNLNGWLFGKDLRELIDYKSQKAKEINEEECSEFQSQFFRIFNIYFNEPEDYYRVALNALRTFLFRANIERVLKEYYPNIIEI